MKAYKVDLSRSAAPDRSQAERPQRAVKGLTAFRPAAPEARTISHRRSCPRAPAPKITPADKQTGQTQYQVASEIPPKRRSKMRRQLAFLICAYGYCIWIQ